MRDGAIHPMVFPTMRWWAMAGFTLPPGYRLAATATMAGRSDVSLVAEMIKAAVAVILIAALWPTAPAAADNASAGTPAPPPPTATTA